MLMNCVFVCVCVSQVVNHSNQVRQTHMAVAPPTTLVELTAALESSATGDHTLTVTPRTKTRNKE